MFITFRQMRPIAMPRKLVKGIVMLRGYMTALHGIFRTARRTIAAFFLLSRGGEGK
jgi:hypothetical protein